MAQRIFANKLWKNNRKAITCIILYAHKLNRKLCEDVYERTIFDASRLIVESVKSVWNKIWPYILQWVKMRIVNYWSSFHRFYEFIRVFPSFSSSFKVLVQRLWMTFMVFYSLYPAVESTNGQKKYYIGFKCDHL